jgi:hypothetical protein
VAGYAVGAMWYMPKVFGNAWMAAMGKKPEELGSPAQAMTVAAVTTLITAVAIFAFSSASSLFSSASSAFPAVGFRPNRPRA